MAKLPNLCAFIVLVLRSILVLHSLLRSSSLSLLSNQTEKLSPARFSCVLLTSSRTSTAFFSARFLSSFFRFSSVLCMLLLRSLLLPIYCMCVYFFEENSDIFQCRVQSERAMRRVTKCEYFDARLENTFCDVSLSENFDNDHRTRLNVEAVFSPPAQSLLLKYLRN